MPICEIFFIEIKSMRQLLALINFLGSQARLSHLNFTVLPIKFMKFDQLLMPRSHIQGLDAGLATDVHSWQSVFVCSFQYCIRNHT